MPASLSWLLEIFKDSNGHWNWPWIGAALVAAGGGIATVIRAIWAIFNFFAERKTGQAKKGGATNVAQSGQGAASGHDTNIGNQYFGVSEEYLRWQNRSHSEQLAAKDAQIAELIKMLLERNPAAAAPGAERAVGEAVESIAEGAEAGDTRLESALNLLKQNKTAEAAQLLNAFAEDKTARAEQDRREAAIAYRNLGAIAGLHDPKAAREAYAKAVALDPGNAEGLFWDGWFQLHAKNLAAAETSYRALLQLAGNGADGHQVFWARTGLGDIAVARGDLKAALAAYKEARSAMERLAGSDAGNAGWQRDLSVSYERVGDVLVSQGNLPEALKSYRAGLVIRERLAGSDAGNAEWQRDLIISYKKIADCNPKERRADLSRALEIARALQASGRLAPADNWMLGELARLIAESPEE
ncbi:MAG TPA: hypothetical protein VLZ74_06355 [Methylocella sp.]|nr:hypothetical protein [Methylocella sp.]